MKSTQEKSRIIIRHQEHQAPRYKITLEKQLTLRNTGHWMDKKYL